MRDISYTRTCSLLLERVLSYSRHEGYIVYIALEQDVRQ